MSKITFRPSEQEEAEAISDFLWSLRDDLMLSEREKADEITELLFEKGGVLGGYQDGEMVAAVGYFIGEPSKDYANKDVGFLYVAGLDDSVRRTTVFYRGWRYVVETMDDFGVSELRWHAQEGDAYTNELYAQLGQHLCLENNRSGHACVLYGTTVADARAQIERKKGKEAAGPAAEESG